MEGMKEIRSPGPGDRISWDFTKEVILLVKWLSMALLIDRHVSTPIGMGEETAFLEGHEVAGSGVQ
jgi:hypothetical protein